MGQKKGAKQNDWCVYKKKYEGQKYEKNPHLYDVPAIDDWVVVWVRKPNYERGRGKDNNILGVYELYDRCIDANRRPLVYQVVGYEYSKDSTVGLVKLESVNSPNYTYKCELDSIRICNGYYRLEKTTSLHPYDALDVIKKKAEDLPVAEYIKSFYKKEDRQ